MSATDLTPVFARLRSIMLPYAERLVRTVDSGDRLSVETRHLLKNGQALWFGGVEVKKNYVSYHLMPVYLEPRLLDTITPALKTRMQGKSCFNFKTPDEALFNELSELTREGFEEYERAGYV